MFDRFSDKAKMSLNRARIAAQELKHQYLGTEHMLFGLLGVGECQATRMLVASHVVPDALAQELRSLLKPDAFGSNGQLPFTPGAKRVLEMAMYAAQKAGHDYIGTEHLLVGIADSSSEPLKSLLAAHKLTAQVLYDAMVSLDARSEAVPPGGDAKRQVLRQAILIATEAKDLETVARLNALLGKLS